MSSLNTSLTNPLRDSTSAAQTGVLPETGASQWVERAGAKEQFDEKEVAILQKHVERFRVSTKAERHKLLVSEVLPQFRTLNLHITQEKWDLRKAVSESGTQ